VAVPRRQAPDHDVTIGDDADHLVPFSDRDEATVLLLHHHRDMLDVVVWVGGRDGLRHRFTDLHARHLLLGKNLADCTSAIEAPRSGPASLLLARGRPAARSRALSPGGGGRTAPGVGGAGPSAPRPPSPGGPPAWPPPCSPPPAPP